MNKSYLTPETCQTLERTLQFVQTVNQVRFLAVAMLAAVFVSLAISDVFLLAQIPGFVVAAAALVSAAVLAIGVAVGTMIDRFS